jgi:pimeloyl-ACP methyl ester carboxylesterase
MPEAVNGDVTLYYEDEGSGPPVLLIHGHTLDRRLWDPVVPSLLGAGFRVLRIDLRGHGLSSRPDFGYHVSHHAADVAAVLEVADAGPVLGVGHSIGGAVVLEVAVTMPQRLAAMVLVSPVMPDRNFEPAFMENLREVAGVIRTEGVPAAMAGPWDSSPLFEHSFRRPEIRQAAAAITRDFPGADYLATQRDRVERTWSLPDRLTEISLPTVVVVGEKEMPGFRAYAEEAASGIPGARFEVFEDCGHLLPLEAPEQLATIVIASTQKEPRSGGRE